MQERRSVNESGIAQFFGRVYGVMGIGMVVTAIVTFILGYVVRDQYVMFLQSNQFAYWIMLFLPLVFVLFGSSAKSIQNPARALTMFLLLSASEGTTLSVIMTFYSGTTAVAALLVTAVIFGTMALVGVYGKKDLSRAGGIATMVLFGAILMSAVNMFLGAAGMAMIINYVILGVFIVLVAYDNQRLRQYYSYAEAQGDVAINALAIQGAMMLYLDFLNLFIVILQIFGVGDSDN